MKKEKKDDGGLETIPEESHVEEYVARCEELGKEIESAHEETKQAQWNARVWMAVATYHLCAVGLQDPAQQLLHAKTIATNLASHLHLPF